MRKGNEHFKYVNKTEPNLDWSQIEAGYHQLTTKERLLIELLAEGIRDKEIAERMFLAEGSVKNYVSKILNKLKISKPLGGSVGNERVILTRIWLARDKFEQFEGGSGI